MSLLRFIFHRRKADMLPSEERLRALVIAEWKTHGNDASLISLLASVYAVFRRHVTGWKE